MRLIDADALKAFIKDQYFQCDMPEEWGNGVMWATSQINHYCNKAPSIDIVRCQDCKHWVYNFNGCSRNPCTEPWFATDFCNYGERESEDECAKEYEELGLKELKELIGADRKESE